MNKLDGVALADLHELLDEVEDKKAVLRVVVGINYTQGVPPMELAEWYDLSRTTVYNWLDRLERAAADPTAADLADAERPGRPPKLSPARRAAVADAIASLPAEVGIEADEWSPAVLQQYIEREYGIQYSRRHTRDLLEELG